MSDHISSKYRVSTGCTLSTHTHTQLFLLLRCDAAEIHSSKVLYACLAISVSVAIDVYVYVSVDVSVTVSVNAGDDCLLFRDPMRSARHAVDSVDALCSSDQVVSFIFSIFVTLEKYLKTEHTKTIHVIHSCCSYRVFKRKV